MFFLIRNSPGVHAPGLFACLDKRSEKQYNKRVKSTCAGGDMREVL